MRNIQVWEFGAAYIRYCTVRWNHHLLRCLLIPRWIVLPYIRKTFSFVICVGNGIVVVAAVVAIIWQQQQQQQLCHCCPYNARHYMDNNDNRVAMMETIRETPDTSPFLRTIHNNYPIAHPWARGLGCGWEFKTWSIHLIPVTDILFEIANWITKYQETKVTMMIITTTMIQLITIMAIAISCTEIASPRRKSLNHTTAIQQRPLFPFPTLRWRHNGPDGVSDHQPHDCLLNRRFGRRSK